MDDVVFTREALRRELASGLELLEKAAEKYDPEADSPTEDAIAAVTILMSPARQKYADALKHRMEMRAREKA